MNNRSIIVLVLFITLTISFIHLLGPITYLGLFLISIALLASHALGLGYTKRLFTIITESKETHGRYIDKFKGFVRLLSSISIISVMNLYFSLDRVSLVMPLKPEPRYIGGIMAILVILVISLYILRSMSSKLGQQYEDYDIYKKHLQSFRVFIGIGFFIVSLIIMQFTFSAQ